MEISIKHYQDLNKNEFHDLVQLRISVFIVEQNCPYMELDNLDLDAYHLILKDLNSQKIIGTLRILKAGLAYNEVSIGRVASHPDHRNQQLGHKMMSSCMDFIKMVLKERSIRLSAQSHLTSFYGKYGFVKTGKEYLEDNIPHSEMLFQE